mgnify:CR=1 FL=1
MQHICAATDLQRVARFEVQEQQRRCGLQQQVACTRTAHGLDIRKELWGKLPIQWSKPGTTISLGMQGLHEFRKGSLSPVVTSRVEHIIPWVVSPLEHCAPFKYLHKARHAAPERDVTARR